MEDTRYVKGLSEMGRRLLELELDLKRKILSTSTSGAARVYRKRAQELAPSLTGRLKAAIYSKRIPEKSSDQRITFYVGVRTGRKYRSERLKKKYGELGLDAYYWRWVEFGHQSSGRALLGKSKSGGVMSVQPKPFLRPAADGGVDEAIGAFGQSMARGLKKYGG